MIFKKNKSNIKLNKPLNSEYLSRLKGESFLENRVKHPTFVKRSKWGYAMKANHYLATKVEGESVVESVVRRMTLAIQKGKIKMGDKLPSEFELMEELGVSRNSLREAMKIMVAMGVIEIKRGDGTYLCSELKPSIFDTVVNSLILESTSNEQIIELRETLDGAVLRLAMVKRQEKDIDKLQKYVEAMREAFKKGEIKKAAQLDYAFHIYLIDCCQNPFLAHICKGIYRLFEASIENNIRTEKLFAKADEHHQDILTCLIHRDESEVEGVVRKSLSSWKQNIG